MSAPKILRTFQQVGFGRLAYDITQDGCVEVATREVGVRKIRPLVTVCHAVTHTDVTCQCDSPPMSHDCLRRMRLAWSLHLTGSLTPATRNGRDLASALPQLW